MSNKQKTFIDIKNRLHPAAHELLNMPDYAQVDQNLVNMSNFFPLIQGLIDAVSPSSICEIGCDQGMTTQVLKQYCRSHGCEFHAVDPSFEKTEKIDDFFYIHKCLSYEYLENNLSSEVYFLDGDHNYHTVGKELRLIHDQKPAGEPCIVFLHDVGWPWGRIDMYYDKNNIPENKQKETEENSLVSLFKDADSSLGVGLPMDGLSVALNDYEKAGVVTAIEDFLAKFPQWDYISIPSVFGLGVMVFRGSETDELTLKFNETRKLFTDFKEFLSILEFNRISLLEQINHAGVIWSKQRDAINEYGETINRLQREMKEFRQLRTENEQMSRDIEVLRTKICDLENQVSRMSSFRGWIMHHIRRLMK